MFEIKINKSVGPFSLKDNINNYLSEFEFEFTPKETEQESWDSYRFKEGILVIYTNKEIIETISCRADCYINNYFLIGMNIDSFWEKFNIDKESISSDIVYFHDDTEQDVYEVETLGLQIWVDEEKKIVTVFVSPIEL